MRTRTLGHTDLQFSAIGFGAWAIGGGDWKFGWGPQDDNDSIAAIHRAVDLGVNWIDTAAVYGFGHSEEVVGRALKGLSQRPFIATKCGRVKGPDGAPMAHLKRASVLAELDASLKRLGVDVIDLYQIHWPQPEEDIEEGWGAIADAVKAGKVRYAGVCNFNVAQLQRIMPIHPVASVQPPYNLLNRDIECDLLPFCAAHNIGVVVYSPMVKGLLSGKWTRERTEALPANDHRRNDLRFIEPQLSANLAIVDRLRPIAQQHGCTVGQLAIAWVLRRPEVTSAIVGARNAAQVNETAQASDLVLSAEHLAEIERILAG